MSQKKEEYLTVEEIATKLRVKPVTINRLIAANQLAATRVGRLWRVKQSDYDRFIEANSTQTEAEAEAN